MALIVPPTNDHVCIYVNVNVNVCVFVLPCGWLSVCVLNVLWLTNVYRMHLYVFVLSKDPQLHSHRHKVDMSECCYLFVLFPLNVHRERDDQLALLFNFNAVDIVVTKHGVNVCVSSCLCVDVCYTHF